MNPPNPPKEKHPDYYSLPPIPYLPPEPLRSRATRTSAVCPDETRKKKNVNLCASRSDHR